MTNKSNLPRIGKLEILGIVIAIVGIIVSLYVPEVRLFLGIDKINTNEKNITYLKEKKEGSELQKIDDSNQKERPSKEDFTLPVKSPSKNTLSKKDLYLTTSKKSSVSQKNPQEN